MATDPRKKRRLVSLPEPKPEVMAVEAAKPMPLEESERTALLKLAKRKHDANRDHQIELAAIDKKESEVIDQIAARLGIESVDIGTRYGLDIEAMRVVGMPPKRGAT